MERASPLSPNEALEAYPPHPPPKKFDKAIKGPDRVACQYTLGFSLFEAKCP